MGNQEVRAQSGGGASSQQNGAVGLLSRDDAVGAAGATGTTGATGAAGSLPNGSMAGNTTYWNGASWVVNSSNIYNNGGNIGINTTTPAGKLHVKGNTNASQLIVELHVRSDM